MSLDRRLFNKCLFGSFLFQPFASSELSSGYNTLSLTTRIQPGTNISIKHEVENITYVTQVKLIKAHFIDSGKLLASHIWESQLGRIVCHQWKSEQDYLNYIQEINYSNLHKELMKNGLYLKMLKG